MGPLRRPGWLDRLGVEARWQRFSRVSIVSVVHVARFERSMNDRFHDG